MAISNKQMKILAFPYTKKYQALICDGAVRSGKTSLMTIAFVDWAMREFNNTNFGICGKTVGSAIKNIITPYMAMAYSKKYNISFTRSDNRMIVRYGNKTNTFYVYGGKDESSYMLIQGITLAGVLLDEVALLSRSFVEQALARCLSYKNRRYWFNCNPSNPKHWFYEEWIQQADKHRALHLHLLMTDNPALDEETIQETENTWSGVFYERYVLGRWVVADGLVYPMFNEPFCVVETIARPYEKYYVSNDYGTNHPLVYHLFGLSRGVWYLIKEFYHDGQRNGQKTAGDYYSDLLEFTKGINIKQFIKDNAPIASSFNVLLVRKGDFKNRLADNDVSPGLQDVATALKTGLLKINDCCKNTIREFGIYSWNPKSTEDEPIKENDDCMDCLRYFVRTLRIVQPKRKSLLNR